MTRKSATACEYLAMQGFEVIEATNGLEALLQFIGLLLAVVVIVAAAGTRSNTSGSRARRVSTVIRLAKVGLDGREREA